MKKNKFVLTGIPVTCLFLSDFIYGMQKNFRPSYLSSKFSTVTKTDFSYLRIEYNNQY
ncbi:hypothetical protein KX00_1233 [Francisella sp. TX07-6608]|nr:hypothetical protein KX00_1233 [Francisella sp. TX07-6608]